MKVVCINNKEDLRILLLTENKIYDVIKSISYSHIEMTLYTVINDIGIEQDFPENKFKKIEDVREEKIIEILSKN